jgi:hypothetical protein
MLTLALWALLAEAPLYTNDDLDRVAPRRGEVGAFTTTTTTTTATTTTAPARKDGRAEAPDRPAKRGEDYWRKEAQRTRNRVRPLRERLDKLRDQIAGRERLPEVRPVTDPQLQAWRKSAAALEERIREEEERLEDRARREGALPGWLR